jgi:hypothetical protein
MCVQPGFRIVGDDGAGLPQAGGRGRRIGGAQENPVESTAGGAAARSSG